MQLMSVLIGVIEGDESTMSDVYCSFILLRIFFKESNYFDSEEKRIMESCLLRCWKGIGSKVYSLLLYCDPYYQKLLYFVNRKYGPLFLQLGDKPIQEEAMEALRELTSNYNHYVDLISDYVQFGSIPEPIFDTLIL